MIFRPASHPFYFACRKVGADPQLQPETLVGTESSNVQGPRAVIRILAAWLRHGSAANDRYTNRILRPHPEFGRHNYLQHQRHQDCYMSGNDG